MLKQNTRCGGERIYPRELWVTHRYNLLFLSTSVPGFGYSRLASAVRSIILMASAGCWARSSKLVAQILRSFALFALSQHKDLLRQELSCKRVCRRFLYQFPRSKITSLRRYVGGCECRDLQHLDLLVQSRSLNRLLRIVETHNCCVGIPCCSFKYVEDLHEYMLLGLN